MTKFQMTLNCPIHNGNVLAIYRIYDEEDIVVCLLK